MFELWDFNRCEVIKSGLTIHEAIYEARKMLGNGSWEVKKCRARSVPYIIFVIERDSEGDLYDGYSIIESKKED